MYEEASEDESGGAGKLLRASYWRLFAKSSKVTSGMKSKRSPALTAGASGCAFALKLKREAASFTAGTGKGRPWLWEATLASLVTLHRQWHVSIVL